MSYSTGLIRETSYRKERETKHQPGRASCSQQHSYRSISPISCKTFLLGALYIMTYDYPPSYARPLLARFILSPLPYLCQQIPLHSWFPLESRWGWPGMAALGCCRGPGTQAPHQRNILPNHYILRLPCREYLKRRKSMSTFLINVKFLKKSTVLGCN